MYSLLLVIIYMAFISLGLPDSLVGSAWPVMQTSLNVPLSYAGLITMIIAGGTIVSSLLSDRLTKRFGAGLITAVSVLITAVALLGFSWSNSFYLLCFWAVPYGLGAGAIDAALNNYVALNYASRHMSWLHCFWGVGAAASPYIMSYYLTTHASWQQGYRAVGIIQLVLTVGLFLSLPLWKVNKNVVTEEAEKHPQALTLNNILKIRGLPWMLWSFFAYSTVEQTTGLWASSYLVQQRAIDPEIAARFASFFFLGITMGRFFSGFVSDRLGDKQLIRVGIGGILLGIFCIFLPLPVDVLAFSGLIIIGLGCAPIYPAIIHATPTNFGRQNSQAVIGVQMASAYLGTTFMPPFFGFLANKIDLGLYPFYLLLFTVFMLYCTERLNRLLVSDSL
ncbi:MFS transporter [Enterococcus olivae]